LKAGYEYLGKLDFEFIGILDADISFEPDYYEKLLVRGLEDPKLGITGGYIYERRMGVYTCRLGNRDFSVAGATQFFRRECYEAVGGICSLKYGGEDWCAEVRARMAGWTVRAMQDLQVFHHRGTGAASNLLRHRFQQGKMDFSMGSLPLFEVVKCVMRLAEGPIVVGGIARCAGFAQSYLLRESRPVSKDFIKYLRTEQKQRLIEAATHSPVQSGLHSESRPTIASDSQGKEIAQRLGHVLIIVENQPVPFDRRAWSEAAALLGKGYDVSVICPKGKNASRSFEIIDGIHIYRHWLPKETNSVFGYLLEYTVALFWEFVLSFRILVTRGFDVIHACNPPDLIFLIGLFYKILFRKRFVFDHHDIGPELYEAKFGRRDFLWRIQLLLERWTFRTANISIATNESFRAIAIERGRVPPERAFVVRTGPDLNRVRLYPPDEKWKAGRRFMVGYVGVIGSQDGLDLLVDSVTHICKKRERSDVQFVIIGDGPELDNIIKLSQDAGLDDVVTFVGRVEDDRKLFTILSTADVCVNPDRPNGMNHKSTTIKIMEYMALGKAIVQFDLVEGRQSAGEASLYARNDDTADFGDKILELLDDPTRSQEMGALGQKRVREVLAWEHEKKKLLEAYHYCFSK
jgi:glycosyltransferase involved in cell wall biosynthesis